MRELGGFLSSRRKKGILAGATMIVLGIASAFIVYRQDVDSLDLVRMEYATKFAILHAALWSVAGAGFIFWYGVGPGSRDGEDQSG